ncbi:MAG: AraC family transcriptional regulator [Sandaracinaceae bacterium]
MDPLSEVLTSMRLESSLIRRSKFTSPWAVRTSGANDAIFHVVMEGTCWLRTPSPSGARTPDTSDTPWDDFELSRGDLILFAHGAPHVLSDVRQPSEAVEASSFRSPPGQTVEHGGGGSPTSILCGGFRLDHAAGSTLLSALPPMVRVSRGDSPLVAWFDQTLAVVESTLDSGEPGMEAVISRLLDVLFVQLLRSATASLPDSGWLAAVRDLHLGRAIAAIHREPGGQWTAQGLARVAGLSRTVFYERFTKMVGETPAAYLARWRVMTASERLRDSQIDLTKLAQELGYGGADSLSRAFKRHVGLTPREYRKAIAANLPLPPTLSVAKRA